MIILDHSARTAAPNQPSFHLQPNESLSSVELVIGDPMKSEFALASGVLAIAALLATGALAQQPLAAEGRGLLPESQPQGEPLSGSAPEHPFVLDPSSGILSRTLFTAEAQGLHIAIRDYAIPPDHKPHTVPLQGAAALVQARSNSNALQFGNQQFALKPESIRPLPATDQLRFLNPGNQLSVTRVILLQARRP
jgi:hypothetical protein